jgi:Peptidase family M28
VAAIAGAAIAGDTSVGVLITGAEELGMMGARRFAAEWGAKLQGAEVVNLDTIDDRGPIWVVSHDARGDLLAEREAVRLAGLGLPVRRRRLPLGILTDSLVLARAGAAAITIARLDWGTLRRIHTPGDGPGGLELETAAWVGRTMAG